MYRLYDSSKIQFLRFQGSPRETPAGKFLLAQRTGRNVPGRLLHNSIRILLPGTGDPIRIWSHCSSARSSNRRFLQYIVRNVDESVQGGYIRHFFGRE